jgi:ethanolamine ammonia-lyase small subunit
MSDLLTLRQFTDSRIALGRAGSSMTARDWLALREAHAAARDAVTVEHVAPDLGAGCIVVASRCRDRREYLLRPDRGRRLRAEDAARLPRGPFDVVIVVADGLSPLAVSRHAANAVEALRVRLAGLALGPIVYVERGRVAIADEIGETMQAQAAAILIGERPGLSAADSLGIYVTYAPRIGRTDAERNCISNIRDGGLGYEAAAVRCEWLIRESLRRQLSGVNLKEAGATASLSPSREP